MTPTEFISKIAPSAQAAMVQTKIPASFTIAQAALESSWGKSDLALRACNLFGVKADSSWKGDFITMPTHEFVKGTVITVQAKWRQYADIGECLLDHAKFLLQNPRYKPAFSTVNVEDFTKAIAAAGYATDPDYAHKIISVIRSHNLTTYDKG